MKFFAALLLAVVAHASTITFGTGLPGLQGNSVTGNNYVTRVDPAWVTIPGTQWVSFQPNSADPPVPNGTLVYYWFNVFVPDPSIYSATLEVAVDDAATVTVDGDTVADSIGDPQSVNCVDGLPNCTQIDYINILGELHMGSNWIEALVEQTGGGPDGIDLWGQIVAGPQIPNSPSPEPSTWVMMGAGLVGIGLLRRKRSA